YGVDFIILDKNETTTRYSKALVVQARSLEIFEEIGLAKIALEEGQEANALNLFYKGKRRATIKITRLGTGLSPFPFALSLEQSKTEKIFSDYISQHGKKIFWKRETIRIEQSEHQVYVYCKDEQGHAQRIQCDFLVGCDGPGSLVRH